MTRDRIVSVIKCPGSKRNGEINFLAAKGHGAETSRDRNVSGPKLAGTKCYGAKMTLHQEVMGRKYSVPK